MESTNISLFVLLGMAIIFVVLTVVSKRWKNAFLALRSDIRWKLGGLAHTDYAGRFVLRKGSVSAPGVP